MRKYPLSLLKDKNIVTFFDFWGKTRRGEKDGGDDYHLLCWHSLDVRGIEGSRVRQTYALLAKQYGVNGMVANTILKTGKKAMLSIVASVLPHHACTVFLKLQY